MEMNSAAEHRSSGVFHHGYSCSLEHSMVIIPHDLGVHMASSTAPWVERRLVARQKWKQEMGDYSASG